MGKENSNSLKDNEFEKKNETRSKPKKKIVLEDKVLPVSVPKKNEKTTKIKIGLDDENIPKKNPASVNKGNKNSNRKIIYDKKTNQIVAKTTSMKKKSNLDDENVPKKNTISAKERNKRRYNQQQKKYRDTIQLQKKTKEELPEKKKELSNKTKDFEKKRQNRKNAIKNKEIKTKVEKKQNNQIKITKINSEKLKEEKRNALEITLINLKKKSIDTFNSVKEKVDDKNIPMEKNEECKNKRFVHYSIEALFYAIIITIINVIAYFVFDYVNILRLFDLKWLNIVVTILLSLIINYMVALLVDFFFTELWVKIKKKREGEHNGDSGFKRRKDKRNSQNKEGK